MRRYLQPLALVLLAAGVAAGVAVAQPVGDVVTAEVEVRVVNVEVFVEDRDGSPVTGLTREDFELLHDGEPIEISHFSAISEELLGEEPAAVAGIVTAASAPRPIPDPLYLVVYADFSFLEPGDLTGALEPLAAFLRRDLGPGDRVMLVTAKNGFEIRQQFTTVPELVIAHFEGLSAMTSGSRSADEFRSILQAIDRDKGMSAERAERAGLSSAGPTGIPRGLLSQIQAYSEEVSDEIERTTDRLAHLVRTMTGLPGRKAVLYLGGRVPTRAARELHDAWQRAYGRFSDRAVPTGQVTGLAEDLAADSEIFDGLAVGFTVLEAEEPLSEVAAVANASAVTLHTLDLGGLRRSSSFISFQSDATLATRTLGMDGTPQLDADRAMSSDHSLAALAKITGGRSLAISRDFGTVLTSIGRDFRTFYSLGFLPFAEPEGARSGGEKHRIEVRLRQGGRRYRVRHRESYRLDTRDRETAQGTVSALLLESPPNPLDVVVAVGEIRPAAGGVIVPLSITLPLSRLALVAAGRAHSGRLTVFVTAGDPIQGLAPVQKAVVPVRIANDELLTSLGRRVEYKMELPWDRRGRIAVTVRDDYRDLTSTVLVLPGG
ncbi:MAG: VWA domain-containing protein [Thermoanaerobaculia bacterium]